MLGWYISLSRAKGFGSTNLLSQHSRRNCVFKRTYPPTIVFPFLLSLYSYLFIYSNKYLEYLYPYLCPYYCPYLCLLPYSWHCPHPCSILPILLLYSSCTSVLWPILLLVNIDHLLLLYNLAYRLHIKVWEFILPVHKSWELV
jgi:hypothetical protein